MATKCTKVFYNSYEDEEYDNDPRAAWGMDEQDDDYDFTEDLND